MIDPTYPKEGETKEEEEKRRTEKRSKPRNRSVWVTFLKKVINIM